MGDEGFNMFLQMNESPNLAQGGATQKRDAELGVGVQ